MIISSIQILYYNIRYKMIYGEKMNVALGIIGSKKSLKKDKIKFNNFLEEASKNIKPNKKSISELLDYLIDNYSAEPYEKDHRSYNRFLLNFLRSKDNSSSIDTSTTKNFLRSIYESKKENESFILKLDDDLSEEIKDLDFIPHFYRFKASESEKNYVQIDIEEISEYINISCGSREIVDDISTYLGVTQNDIDFRTDNFKRYALTLRDMDFNNK